MEFVPGGEGDDVVPKGLGPASLCTDEENQDSAGGVRRLLVADGADGERMGGKLVDGGDGEEEVLSWGPWSTFWSENGEADRLSGHEFGESVSRRRDVSLRGRHQAFDSSGHARDLSQQRGVVLAFVVFRHRIQVAHFETNAGKGRFPRVLEGLLPRRGIRHLALKNAVYPEPPNGAPSPFGNPNDEGAPAPPSDGRMMHTGGVQGDRDEEDVKCIEGFIEVVAEEAERRGDQEGERDERLK